MFGSDNNSLSKKINAQQQRKVKKWGRGVGPLPVVGDQEYLEELAIQAKEKRKQQEEEAKRDKEEIFKHYKNYSLATSERTKDMWNEEDEAELYKEPTHAAVNNVREDLFGGKTNEEQESYSFNRHRPRRMEQLHNTKNSSIENDGMSQLSSKLSPASNQPKGKREEAYERKRMMRMMKKNGEAELFDDDNVSSLSSNSHRVSPQQQQENLFGSDQPNNSRSKSTPKNISQRDLAYEQKRQAALGRNNPIIQRRQHQEITNDPESDYENDKLKYVENNKPNYAKPTRKKNQEIVHDPESDYEHEQEKYSERNRNQIVGKSRPVKNYDIVHDPESDFENEQEKYNFQEANLYPKRLIRSGGNAQPSQSPNTTVITPTNDARRRRANSTSNSRDYDSTKKQGGNIFDKMGSNDPPIPRRRGLNRLFNDYPPSPSNNSQASQQNANPFQQQMPQSQHGYNNNALQTPRSSYLDENYHRSVSKNGSRNHTAVPESDFYIGSSSNSTVSSSPVSHTRKPVFKSELYGRDDTNRKQQQQAEYRQQLKQQLDQRGNQRTKKEFQEDVLLPSQKSQEDESRSPSSKFSNRHFHQLESNLPFGNNDVKPISPNKPPPSITNLNDNSRVKMQKKLEYQEELKKQLEAKKRAEEDRKLREAEEDKKIEENIRRNAEIDRLQVEKERREKEAKNNPASAASVGETNVKSNQRSKQPEPVVPVVQNNDVKNDLFGNPSEARRNRRQKDTITIEDTSPPPVNNPMQVRDDSSKFVSPPNSDVGITLPNVVANNPQTGVVNWSELGNQITPQLLLQFQVQQMQQMQMAQELHSKVDKSVISYLLTQLVQSQFALPPQNQSQFALPQNGVPLVNNLVNLQQQQQNTVPISVSSPPQQQQDAVPVNLSTSSSSSSQKAEKVKKRGSTLSRSIENPQVEEKPVALKQELSLDDRPIRPKKFDIEEQHSEVGKKEPEAAPIRRRRKKPSLEDELGDVPKSSKVGGQQDEAPLSASKKSKRVFKIGGGAQKNDVEETPDEEKVVRAQPTIPKPSIGGGRSRRVFSVGKGPTNHESSPIHSQPLSDDEYRNLDSD